VSETTTTIQPLEPRSQAVASLRAKLMEGIASVPIFAEASDKTERTIFSWIAEGMPVTYIGRTPFVVVDPALEWLRNRKHRRKGEARGRGRPKKTI
jgi:hypothetical protein